MRELRVLLNRRVHAGVMAALHPLRVMPIAPAGADHQR